ncbi:HK97 gp10 family phage protein [[Mycobacterium] crassicus]|uniref:HK97 gp10 family phage protein n=1 Tax=[Mycobacterium] crassicus TaxID=2872309 RepID=A0ABU5XGA9_9MYCO|nr:HK97 gp10 family phage protein [Mycolicibacter sp. MYC098]MEB3021310.1 HK97 gp10 family phage protein [Mycolicibacter sp. MYC098]
MAKANPLVALGVPQSEIEDAIQNAAEAKAAKRDLAKKMVAHAKGESPVDHGDYAAAWYVDEDRRGNVRIVNDNFKAHWIEDGTGGSSPTPEFAVAAKTAIAFGGTAGDVINKPRK